MECFFDRFKREGYNGEPWTIVGKGPSFSRLHEIMAKPCATAFLGNCLGLNHAAAAGYCDVAHAIDVEPALELAEWCYANEVPLVMPWQPHERCNVGSRTLDELARDEPLIGQLSRDGLLLWYNHSYAKVVNQESAHVVRVRYFSAEAALHLLLLAGVRSINTIGLDGGRDYEASFDRKDLLRNGQPSFDRQFPEMEALAKAFEAEVVKL